MVRAGKGFKWVRNADGIWFRSFAFCEDKECPDEGGGWTGKFPDIVAGGGMVRGSYFYECGYCQRTWTFSDAEREWRMSSVLGSQRVDQAEEVFRGWPVWSWGTRAYFQYTPGVDPLSVMVIGYLRDPRLDYALTGIVRVRVTEGPRGAYSVGSVIDVGVANLMGGPDS